LKGSNMGKLAVNGGTPVRSKPFPAWPRYTGAERENLMKVFESGNWGGYPAPNTKAKEFAEAFASLCGAKFGICCSNGSVTLETALLAAGIRASDEVIVPCYTWIATAGAPVHVNAVPVFVDVQPDSYCIDPDRIEEAITSKTKAIIPVHLGANVADMDRIMEIASKYNLIVIEDCAHAHGAQWRNRLVGSIGTFGSFSFQSSKLMTAGEGGIILTSDSVLAQKCHSIVNCGRKHAGYDEFDDFFFGWNNRITEFQAAILLGQITHFEEDTAHRSSMAEYFCKNVVKEVHGITPLPADRRITRRTYYQLIMKYDAGYFKDVPRERFLEALLAEGVDLDGTFYIPIYHSPLFNVTSDQWPMIRERYGDSILKAAISCPVAEKAAYEEAIWMHYPYLMGTEEDVDDIICAMKKIQLNIDELL
jgi:dTDP-4-amino-4,6-dideoxygalactose transaminase